MPARRRASRTSRLSGSLGWKALALAALGGSGALLATLAASVDWPVHDGGPVAAQVDAQQAVLEQARLELPAAMLTPRRMPRTASPRLAGSRAQARRSARPPPPRAQALALARQRRTQAGLIDFTTLLDAHRTLLALDNSQAGAETDLRQMPDPAAQGPRRPAAAADSRLPDRLPPPADLPACRHGLPCRPPAPPPRWPTCSAPRHCHAVVAPPRHRAGAAGAGWRRRAARLSGQPAASGRAALAHRAGSSRRPDHHRERQRHAEPPRSAFGSELSGTIRKVHVDVNDAGARRPGADRARHHAGAALVQITRSRAALAAAQAAVRRAEATQAEQRAGLARLHEVRGSPTARCPRATELDAARAALARAEAAVASARASVADATAALRMDQTSLRQGRRSARRSTASC